MATSERLATLQHEYEAGQTALAFFPYATALRRERRYLQAIEVCQQGLTRNPTSVAGRTLLGRLLCDIGRYEESLGILEPVHEQAPGAAGVGIAVARTLVKMHELERAEALLEEANRSNPLDPEVQLLNTAVRRLRAQQRLHRIQAPHSPASEVPPTTPEEVLESIIRRVSQVASPESGLMASLRGRYEPVRLGGGYTLLPFLDAYRELRKAYEELEYGMLLRGEFEWEGTLILFTARQDDLVFVAIRSCERTGRIKSILELAVTQLVPSAQLDDTAALEIEE
jgi:tetratricopeptide (TPR) repeat protein